jgi:Domain of unknown function (DUF4281)
MNLETLFSAAGAAAMAGWLLLLLVPHRVAAARLVVGSIAVALAMLYAALIGSFISSGSGGFGSLAQVAQLFRTPGLLLAGWVHYLCFDLLVGLWQRDEAARIGMPRLWLAPCLLLTFLFGPIGWLLFMGLRFQRLRVQAATA